MPVFVQLFLLCVPLTLLQVLAALPWLVAIDPEMVKGYLRRQKNWLTLLGGCLAAALVAAVGLSSNTDPGVLSGWGRIYASVLQLQLAADVIVFLFWVLLRFWRRGGAVALAAFREGVRQPMFWLLLLAAGGLMAFSLFIPYFTFGEDLKMVKELCYAQIMLATVAFGVIAASSSVHEEIEGRTAVTLMSKPVARRHFLLGKFVGTFTAGLVMTAVLGWLLVWAVLYKEWEQSRFYQNAPPDPAWVTQLLAAYVGPGEVSAFLKGSGLWVNDSLSALPGLVIGSCQVMVLVAIAVALATRMPMVVTLPVCVAVYFLGHLTPILTAVSTNKQVLIAFLAQVFDLVLPGLDLFDMSTAIIRDAPLPPAEFSLYTLNVTLYAVVYTAIALLFGLILFEDRDLA